MRLALFLFVKNKTKERNIEFKVKKRIKFSTMRTTMWQEMNSRKQTAYLEYACSIARQNSALIITKSVELEQGFYAENSIHDPNRGRPRC